MSPTVLLPGAEHGHWALLRHASAVGLNGGQVSRQDFRSLDEAALQLSPGEPFVLELPTDLGLIQRLVLPAAEPAEIEEMARIQVEKILPYAAESVGFALEEISRSASEVVVAVQAAHHDRLMMLGAPLAARGCWPARVTLRVSTLPAPAPAEERTAFLYAESGKAVLGIAEAGHLSFAQALSSTTPDELASELPAVLLGAELEGIPARFGLLRLDRHYPSWRDGLAHTLGTPVQLFDPDLEAISATSAHAGDLAPALWRGERQRVSRLATLRRRLLMAGGVYLALLLLGLLSIAALKLRLGWLNSRRAALGPAAEIVRADESRWKTLGAAIDPNRYVVETLLQSYQCLPPDDSVRLTTFDTSLDRLTLQGEAPNPAAAADFTEKLKAAPGLRHYQFKADPPSILPNGHARFKIEGTTS